MEEASVKKWDTRGFDNFDRLECLYEIEGVLINETPLRIGMGSERLGSVDNPVLRDHNNRVFIPGSSIKGVLRIWAERIARDMGFEVHDPWEISEKSNYDADPVEVIFGSQRLASHVYIFDAFPEGEARTFVKPSVAIDRFLGSSYPQALYNIEFVEPYTRWKFRMRIFNIDLEGGGEDFGSKVSSILKTLLEILKDPGIQIGGKASTGGGLVRLAKYEVYKYSFKGGRLIREKVEI